MFHILSFRFGPVTSTPGLILSGEDSIPQRVLGHSSVFFSCSLSVIKMLICRFNNSHVPYVSPVEPQSRVTVVMTDVRIFSLNWYDSRLNEIPYIIMDRQHF